MISVRLRFAIIQDVKTLIPTREQVNQSEISNGLRRFEFKNASGWSLFDRVVLAL